MITGEGLGRGFAPRSRRKAGVFPQSSAPFPWIYQRWANLAAGRSSWLPHACQRSWENGTVFLLGGKCNRNRKTPAIRCEVPAGLTGRLGFEGAALGCLRGHFCSFCHCENQSFTGSNEGGVRRPSACALPRHLIVSWDAVGRFSAAPGGRD